MKKNKKLIFLIFVLAALFLGFSFFSFPRSAYGCDDTFACNYNGNPSPACDYSCFSGPSTPPSNIIYIPDGTVTGLPDPPGRVEGVLKNILNWMLGIVGIIAVIGFIISGIQYILAAGSEKTIETAKRNMTYCILGVIVALSGFVIIKAVDAALRATSTTF